MKEEELIKKLENVELPTIEMQSHRRRLRMALLDAGYLKRQREVTILELAKSKVKGGIDTMIRGLVSRQPVWKTAVVSMLALVLVVGLSLTIPSLSAESVYAQAAEIAKNSPQVRAALGDGEVQVVKVIKLVDDKGTVICEGTMGRLVTAEVDLKTKEVTGVKVAIEIVDMPELTEADEAEAINIAKADPRVKELLDQGASIGKVLPMYSFGMRTDTETGELVELSGMLVRVVIELGEKSWIVHVDLDEGKVVRLIEIETLMPAESYSGPVGQFKLEDLDVDEEGRIELHIGEGGIERNTQ